MAFKQRPAVKYHPGKQDMKEKCVVKEEHRKFDGTFCSDESGITAVKI